MARRSSPGPGAFRRDAAPFPAETHSSRRARRFGASRAAWLLTLLGLTVIAAAGGAIWARRQLAPVNPSDKARRSVRVEDGTNVAGLADRLARLGLIRSAHSLLLAARLDKKSATHLQPGIYLIAPSQTPSEILREVAGGRMLVQIITVPEGFTLKQIIARLDEHRLGHPDELSLLARTQGRTFHADGFTPPSDNLEGYLFPQTYDFDPGDTSRQLLQLMVDQFAVNVVRPHPEVRDWTRPVILGSLVEREAKIDLDRPVIAGVLDNRLRLNMPLQVDATVEYALPEHKARLFYSDLKTPSSYNTYLHRGLPPGPICCPGLPSIEAALKPATVDYLYYVAAPDGSHRFSRTLAGQDRNIAAVRNAADGG